jgi:hypothetical protein
VGQDRQQARDDRQGNRQDTRGDRQQTRDDRQGNRQDTRGDRQEGRQETRNERQGDRQDTRGDRQENRQETRGDRQENRGDRQGDRQEARGDRQENRQENRGDRQENRQDLRQNWQDQRDQIRQDWQDYGDQAREDWQGYLDDHYGQYGDWYSGYAPGYWDQSDSLWDNYPVAAAAGLTWWGANALGYQFGYSDYSNPYYTEEMPAYYNEPILTESYPAAPVEITNQTTVAPSNQTNVAPSNQTNVAPADQAPAAAAPPPGVSSEALDKFDQARADFLDGQYDSALKLTDAAIAKMPHDAVLHEFRSLVLFALQRYAESAATIHPVLDVGPGWDWKTLSGLYANVDTYTQQLRALEAARDKDPKNAALRFLLGYHYLTCGFPEQAAKEFSRVVEQKPKDSVSTALLATVSPRDAQQTQEAPSPETPKDVPPDSVIGSWSAQGQGKSHFAMNLGKDGSFTWGFTSGGRKQEVKGVFTVEANVLAMEPDSGGTMLAEVSLKEPNTLHFKMIGGKSDDPGLNFQREPAKPGK